MFDFSVADVYLNTKDNNNNNNKMTIITIMTITIMFSNHPKFTTSLYTHLIRGFCSYQLYVHWFFFWAALWAITFESDQKNDNIEKRIILFTQTGRREIWCTLANALLIFFIAP